MGMVKKKNGAPDSLSSHVVQSIIRQAQDAHRGGETGRRLVRLKDDIVEVPVPFPSPSDWRDHWIYFLLIDRFNNPGTPPRKRWDRACHEFQGGTINGIRAQLDYLKDLGV